MLNDIPIFAQDTVLFFADKIAFGAFIGWVVIGFVGALSASIIWYVISTWSQIKAINWLNRVVSVADSPNQFAKQFDTIQSTIGDGVTSHNGQKAILSRVWEEYCETLVKPSDHDDHMPVRNTLRPSYFFNSGDLGFDRGFWKHLPSFFVSIGLFLTFLGIISALNALSSFDDESMRSFLQSAKAKFIMSLSGLGVSIVFTVVYRIGALILERSVDKLCDSIEFRVLFQTREQLGFDQLEQLREQTGLFKRLGNDMGAQVGQAVAESLTQQLTPILTNINNSAGNRVSGMVGELGNALHAKLNESLNEMSSTLSAINTSLLQVSERLTHSGGTLSQEIASGIDNIKVATDQLLRGIQDREQSAREARSQEQTATHEAISILLESIEQNTRDNSNNINEAAQNLAKAVESLTGAIQSAGDEVKKQATSAVQNAGDVATAAISTAGARVENSFADSTQTLLDGLKDFQNRVDSILVDPIKLMAAKLAVSNTAISENAVAMKEAAASNKLSADTLNRSTMSLASAAVPIRDSVASLAQINSQIGQSIAEMREAMDAALNVTNASNSAMKTAIQELQQVVMRADDLDEKLGGAFERILKGVEQSEEKVMDYVAQVTTKFTQATQSLQQVVDGISEFQPANKS